MSLDYDHLAPIYDRLYGDEQSRKYSAVAELMAGRNTVLDVGCGTGLLAEFLCKVDDYTYYVGIDVSGGMLSVASSKQIRGMVDLVRASATLPPFRSSSFDCVAMFTVIHEVSLDSVRRIARLVKREGVIIVSVLRKTKEIVDPLVAMFKSTGLRVRVIDIDDLKDVIVVAYGPGSTGGTAKGSC